jgi:putative aldouronate transport system permease protein
MTDSRANRINTAMVNRDLRRGDAIRKLVKSRELYIMLIPVVVYYILFHYAPMYGVLIAFKKFSPTKGILGSDWVGLKYFLQFFNGYDCWDLIRNTLTLSIYALIVGFPFPIILAVLLNEVKNKPFKKTVQMVTYAPHFISVVVLVGMLNIFLARQNGAANILLSQLGLDRIDFMGRADMFSSIYVWSGVWQGAGWGSIIYLSAISGIDPELYDAAYVDGATKLHKIWHIDLPGILPTAVILLIMNVGSIMSVGFEKVLLMQNQLNMRASDIISTYVYRVGIQSSEYGLASAVGLFNSVINLILLVSVNYVAKRVTETSLW